MSKAAAMELYRNGTLDELDLGTFDREVPSAGVFTMNQPRQNHEAWIKPHLDAVICFFQKKLNSPMDTVFAYNTQPWPDGKGGRYKGYAEGYVEGRERVHAARSVAPAAHKNFDEFDVADTGAKVENTHPTECVVVGRLFDNSAQDLGYNCMAYAEFFVKRG